MFNRQGSARGETEFKAPNWWMGMAQRPLAHGTLTINLMASLDPLTVGGQGYSHILQTGEFPVSLQIFGRVRPPSVHRMVDVTMTRPHGR